MRKRIKTVEKKNEGSYYKIEFEDDTKINYFVNEDASRQRLVTSLVETDLIEYTPVVNGKNPAFSEEIKIIEKTMMHLPGGMPSAMGKEAGIILCNRLNNRTNLMIALINKQMGKKDWETKLGMNFQNFCKEIGI